MKILRKINWKNTKKKYVFLQRYFFFRFREACDDKIKNLFVDETFLGHE